MLQPTTFTPTPSLTGPKNVLVTHHKASLSTSESTRWEIECPPYAFLDSEVLVDWVVRIFAEPGSDSVFAPFGGSGESLFSANERVRAIFLPSTDSKWALRQGAVIAKAMRRVRIWWNEALIEHTPSKYAAVMERFYASGDEIRNLCSMSGGDLDTGFGQVPGEPDLLRRDDNLEAPAATVNVTTGNVNEQVLPVGDQLMHVLNDDWSAPVSLLVASPAGTVTANFHRDVPKNKHTQNLGFMKRFERVIVRFREQGVPADQPPVPTVIESVWPDELTLTLTERLPCGPFKTWQSRDKTSSLANAGRLRIEIDWESNPFLVTQASGNVDDVTPEWFSTAPTMHLRWLVPPSTVEMPRQIMQPVKWYDTRELRFNMPEIPVGEFSLTEPQLVSFNRMTWHRWPDKFFIYARTEYNSFGVDSPLEQHMEIKKLVLRVDGQDGKLNTYQSSQLFALYLRNCPVTGSREFDFEQWRRRYCCVVLNKEDFTLDQRVEDGHSMSLDVLLDSHWIQPNYLGPFGVDYHGEVRNDLVLYVVGEYTFPLMSDKRKSVFMKP